MLTEEQTEELYKDSPDDYEFDWQYRNNNWQNVMTKWQYSVEVWHVLLARKKYYFLSLVSYHKWECYVWW